MDIEMYDKARPTAYRASVRAAPALGGIVNRRASVHDKWAIEFCETDQVVSGVKAGSGVKTHSRIVAVFSRQPDASWKVALVIALPG